MNMVGGEEGRLREEKRMTRMKISNCLFLGAWLREALFRSKIIGVHYIHSKYNLKCKTLNSIHLFFPTHHQWDRFQSYSNWNPYSAERAIGTAVRFSPERRLETTQPRSSLSGWHRACCANSHVQGIYLMGSLLNVCCCSSRLSGMKYWMCFGLVCSQPGGLVQHIVKCHFSI